ncbi:ATP-binding protein [Streptosporangium subroseum]|uniref:ATP-binding protein n=1 Tax=Streptosporangium subroseum TaxID=106412 RepID=UPI003448F365
MSAREEAHHGVTDEMSKRRDALRVLGQREFYGIPQSAGIARRWVVDLLSAHVSGEVLEMAELLVGEVVANAVVHSDSRKPGGLVTVWAGLDADLIHIEVIDDGSATSVPTMRLADDDSLNGRGLGRVDLLASAWGIGRDDEAGGILWFQIPHDGPTPS